MENKNTMLLTVIAVATLLVAVVGGTFAYFTATATTTNATATVTGTTGTLSTVAVNGTTKVLRIDTVVSDFSKTDTDYEPYYAVETGNYARTAQNHVLGTVAIAGDGRFNCTYTVNIKVTNRPTGMVAADGKVVVTGDGITNGTINISDITATTGTTLTGSWTGLTKDSSENITVDAYIVNTAQPQNYLQGLGPKTEYTEKCVEGNSSDISHYWSACNYSNSYEGSSGEDMVCFSCPETVDKSLKLNFSVASVDCTNVAA